MSTRNRFGNKLVRRLERESKRVQWDVGMDWSGTNPQYKAQGYNLVGFEEPTPQTKSKFYPQGVPVYFKRFVDRNKYSSNGYLRTAKRNA